MNPQINLTVKDLTIPINVNYPDNYPYEAPQISIDGYSLQNASFKWFCGYTILDLLPQVKKYLLNDYDALCKLDIKNVEAIHEDEIQIPVIKSKLSCSVTRRTLEDHPNMLLGYPIKINIDRRGRYWFTPIFELISYETHNKITNNDKFNINKLRFKKFKSPQGKIYNFWLPCYFTQTHFENAQPILNEILDNNPKNILRILPLLINKSIINFSDKSIDCYANLLQLMLEYLELHPNLKTIIDLEIKSFMTSSKVRHKLKTPDIGEFIIKLYFSNYDYNNVRIRHVLIKEYFTRQIYWMFKNNSDIAKTFYYPKNINLDDCFNASNANCSTLLLVIETFNFFMFSDIKNQLRKCRGFPPHDIIQTFLTRINWIKTNVSNYRNFIKEIHCSDIINNDFTMKKYLRDCCVASYKQGYTTFDPDYRKNQQKGKYKRKNAFQVKITNSEITTSYEDTNPFSVLNLD
jgi:hypothetical protein